MIFMILHDLTSSLEMIKDDKSSLNKKNDKWKVYLRSRYREKIQKKERSTQEIMIFFPIKFTALFVLIGRTGNFVSEGGSTRSQIVYIKKNNNFLFGNKFVYINSMLF
jgi:hypothetical protein